MGPAVDESRRRIGRLRFPNQNLPFRTLSLHPYTLTLRQKQPCRGQGPRSFSRRQRPSSDSSGATSSPSRPRRPRRSIISSSSSSSGSRRPPLRPQLQREPALATTAPRPVQVVPIPSRPCLQGQDRRLASETGHRSNPRCPSSTSLPRPTIRLPRLRRRRQAAQALSRQALLSRRRYQRASLYRQPFALVGSRPLPRHHPTPLVNLRPSLSSPPRRIRTTPFLSERLRSRTPLLSTFGRLSLKPPVRRPTSEPTRRRDWSSRSVPSGSPRQSPTPRARLLPPRGRLEQIRRFPLWTVPRTQSERTPTSFVRARPSTPSVSRTESEAGRGARTSPTPTLVGLAVCS